MKAFPRVFVSALTGEGLDKLRKQMTVALQSINEKVQLYFPKEEEYKIYELSRESQILKSEPASTGTVLEAQLTPEQLSRWGAYLLKK